LTGLLLTNLGTPDAPTAPALRRYLREFLSDRRVIELPRWKWLPILHLFVLTFRPKKSAALYRNVWTPEGSPLLTVTKQQGAALQERFGDRLRVAVGMRYGNPSIASALDELEAAGCRRVLVLPLYPQYSASTTASTYDAVFDALKEKRWMPAVRTITSYHDEPAYLDALAASIREFWDKEGEPRRLLVSFHGIPLRYSEAGDPYRSHCETTGRALAARLGLPDERWRLCFQSRFGKEEWLQPYADETLRLWGQEKLESVDTVCPGFAADCLETLDEMGRENREEFEKAGGGRYRYLPALNARPDHIDALAEIVERNLQGWK
jgi:ferrochelatase